MPEKPSVTISRTIYDPATKDFVTSSPDAKALPHVKEWINQHNPVIYWYVLRIDNASDDMILQWAVELYAHQALTITEAYVDGSDRRFEPKKREHNAWNDKYVLAIPEQIGIPIVSKGIRRIFFKVDIDCKEGLMHEYGISGKFIAQGTDPVEIKEKMFQYSCKVGEFRQIFDKDPHAASSYAEKKLAGKYSSHSVHVFTNSFRIIHELYGYCHSKTLDRDVLLQKLHLLHTSFEGVPEIAGARITPLIHDGIRELDIIVDRNKFAPRFIRLCDALVELLHMEVMDADMRDGGADAYTSPSETPVRMGGANGQKECPSCGNVISESNKSLICMECETRFCHTCEEWFRKEERKRGQKPLCEKCFDAEHEVQLESKLKEKDEQDRQRKEEAEKKATEEAERNKKKEGERLRSEQEQKESELKAKDEWEEKNRLDELRKRQEEEKERLRIKKDIKIVKPKLNTFIVMLVLIFGIFIFVFWAFAPNTTNIHDIKDPSSQLGNVSDVSQASTTSSNQDYTNSIGMEFMLVRSGEFDMGSTIAEILRDDDESPAHRVNFEYNFYIGKYEVTQKQWTDIMGYNPSLQKGDDFPVTGISWNDVQNFIEKLNEKESTDKYRLPSEAEWEYSAKGGTTTQYNFGDDVMELSDYAWYDDNSNNVIHTVGQKMPNAFGLYDAHGNVWEWVQDRWHYNYDGAPANGTAWEENDYFDSNSRVVRGGSFNDHSKLCRSANRDNKGLGIRSNNLGFRLVKDL